MPVAMPRSVHSPEGGGDDAQDVVAVGIQACQEKSLQCRKSPQSRPSADHLQSNPLRSGRGAEVLGEEVSHVPGSMGTDVQVVIDAVLKARGAHDIHVGGKYCGEGMYPFKT